MVLHHPHQGRQSGQNNDNDMMNPDLPTSIVWAETSSFSSLPVETYLLRQPLLCNPVARPGFFFSSSGEIGGQISRSSHGSSITLTKSAMIANQEPTVSQQLCRRSTKVMNQ
ncbi:hypothetical protein ACLOJK_023291 [Asimina triloba]